MRLRLVVINLARRTDRLSAFAQRFKLVAPHNVPVARFSAVDGAILRDSRFLRRLFRQNDFEFKCGVMGCSLSHFELWHQLLRDRSCDGYIVLEDDVLFADNFWTRFQQLLQAVPKESGGAPAFDFLFLGGMEPEARINHLLAVAKPNAGHGTFGYVVTRAGARNAIGIAMDEGIRSGADWFLIRHFGAIRALTAWPELCAGLIDVDSDIQQSEAKLPESFAIEPAVLLPDGKIPVHLRGNWCSSNELRESWNRLTDGSYSWGRIVVAPEESPAVIEVIVNSADVRHIGPRSIVLQMEPLVGRSDWGFWRHPDPGMFARVFSHGTELNAVEWHLSRNRRELAQERIEKSKDLSTVTSGAYLFEGHRKRLDFLKFLEQRGIPFDHFGKENPLGLASYRGALPPYQKDAGLFPYRYTFAGENCAEAGYATEKIWDGILAECLTFYWGCPNLESFIDPLSFVRLDLDNFESAAGVIEEGIRSDLYSKRLPHIKAAKERILNELNIFPRLERACSEILAG